MKKILLVILSACILVACNKNKKVVVDATYADGLPKKVSEYIIKEDGSQQLAKETYYFPEKKKYIEGEYNNKTQRQGVWTSWYENGQKNSQGTYENGVLEGIYTVWHPNGQVYYSGKYLHGKQIGKWVFYDSLGTIAKEINY